jgi:hypothetical protein
MREKTAVEWLEELIECGADLEQIKKFLPKAKELEKKQIIDAYDNGKHLFFDAYEYYKQMFVN